MTYQLFGLNLLEHLIKFKFESIQSTLKQHVIQLIQSSDFSNKLISQKLSLIFTLSAVKLFQQWLDINQFLKQLYTTDKVFGYLLW